MKKYKGSKTLKGWHFDLLVFHKATPRMPGLMCHTNSTIVYLLGTTRPFPKSIGDGLIFRLLVKNTSNGVKGLRSYQDDVLKIATHLLYKLQSGHLISGYLIYQISFLCFSEGKKLLILNLSHNVVYKCYQIK